MQMSLHALIQNFFYELNYILSFKKIMVFLIFVAAQTRIAGRISILSAANAAFHRFQSVSQNVMERNFIIKSLGVTCATGCVVKNDNRIIGSSINRFILQATGNVIFFDIQIRASTSKKPIQNGKPMLPIFDNIIVKSNSNNIGKKTIPK